MKMFIVSREEASKIYDSCWYKNIYFTDEDKVVFQLFTDKVCMPFDLFMSLTNKLFKEDMTTIAFGQKGQIEYLQNLLLHKHGENGVERVFKDVLKFSEVEVVRR